MGYESPVMMLITICLGWTALSLSLSLPTTLVSSPLYMLRVRCKSVHGGNGQSGFIEVYVHKPVFPNKEGILKNYYFQQKKTPRERKACGSVFSLSLDKKKGWWEKWAERTHLSAKKKGKMKKPGEAATRTCTKVADVAFSPNQFGKADATKHNLTDQVSIGSCHLTFNYPIHLPYIKCRGRPTC